MDFNNNGKFDLEDLILTEIILEDEENGEDNKGGGSNKPSGGGCLTSFLLIIGTPIIGILLLANAAGVL